jgi:mannuronan 5-epimerase
MVTTFATTGILSALFLYTFSSIYYASFSPYFHGLYASSSIEESSLKPSSFSSSNCLEFDSKERMIKILCESASLTDIRNQITDPDILNQEKDNKGIWSLNAGIEIAKNSTLFINSTDTSWLRIIGDGNTAHLIHVFGTLKIDSVKVTSWNPNINNYTRSQDSDRDGKDVNIGTPRPYIVVDNEATGTTDITNSEIAYLGYESGYGGNNIHYGLDPHTGTHDMTIRNNTVHDNGSIGIICSLVCYNILIEGNEVYNNTKMGIMFSRNMYDSVARNNIVNNENRGIVISESHNNKIYANVVSDSGGGIDVDDESFENVVYDNIIANISETHDEKDVEVDVVPDVNDQTMKDDYAVSYRVS